MLDEIPAIKVGRLTIPRGSKLLAFTDGLVELERGDEVTSGQLPLEKILSSPVSMTENIVEIKAFIKEHMSRKSIFDDISVIGMEF